MQTGTDLIIIGAGPTGLAAAFYAGMRGLSVRIVDPLSEPGGQLVALYPEKYIYDVVGFPKIKAADLAARLIAQVKPFNPVFSLEERAEELKREEDAFYLTTDKGHTYRAKAVLIAAGLGVFEPRRVGAENERELEGKGLFYAVKHPEEFKNKRVLIVGGGDSAVDWALMLKDLAQVTLIHRRHTFRAHERSVQQLMAAAESGQLEVKTPYRLTRVEGDDWVHETRIENVESGQSERLPVDAVLVLAGFLSKPGPLARWGLALEKGRIKVNCKMETNLEGVYAAGDAVTYPGKLKLIQVNFGEAATAANHAAAYVTGAKVQPGHSSDRPDPAEKKSP